MSTIVIIGAGLAGLSTACHLSRTGHDVTVLESRSQVGGLAGRITEQGYTFDTGPTVLTMPGLIDEALTAAGSSLDALPMTRVDPAYRAHFADGSLLDVWSEPARMAQEIRENSGAADAAAYEDLVAWLKELTEIELPNFIDRNFDSPFSLAKQPGVMARLLRMGGFAKLQPQVQRRFTDPRLSKLFTFQSLYAGLAPQEALGIYGVISYMDCVEGVFYPRGGIHALPEALAAAAQAAGVDIRTDCAVTSVRTAADGRVTGVVAGDETFAADAVVCTIDPHIAFDTLLKDARPRISLRRPRFAPSAVVWHVGAAGLPSKSARHHNVHFGNSWEPAFDDLITHGKPMRDPSRLVTVPSLTEPARAPAGNTAMYVLEPVPNLQIGTLDWDAYRDEARDKLLQFLAREGYPTDIQAETLVTPADWRAQQLPAGTPFSLAHTFPQTGPFRPRNVVAGMPGMFLASGGTTPGVGVPMVLISGKLAAERTLHFLQGARR